MKRAILYARVSTDEQAEKGYSLQTQFEAMREYAARNGMTIIRELQDDYSGAKLDRPALDVLRGMIERKEADVVIVFAADRLSRNLAHLLILREELQRAGVELHYVNRGKSEDTAESRLTENIEGVIAEFEREKIKERTRRGKLAKAKSGKWVGSGTVPYPFRKVGERGAAHLEIDEVKVAVVRRIVDMLLGRNGYAPTTVKGIAKQLKSEGVPSAALGAKAWWAKAVRSILKRKTILGEFEYLGVMVKFPELAIIDRATYDEVQAVLERNHRLNCNNRKFPYLFSGFAKCVCGGSFNGRHRRAHGQDYYYYICNVNHAERHMTNCREGAIHVEIFEPLVWNWLVGLLTDDEKLEKGLREYVEQREGELAKTRERLSAVNELIQRVERKMTRLAKDIDDMEDEDSRSGLKALLGAHGKEKAGLIKEREKLTAELEQREITEEDSEQIREYAREIRRKVNGKPTYEEKRALFAMLDLNIQLRHNEGGRELFVKCGLAVDGETLGLKTRKNYAAKEPFLA